jgi:hypothetical protein
MAQKIQLRRDTAANWTSANPILAQGEVGYEIDTSKDKVGDGVTAWNSRPYTGVATAGWTQSGAGAVSRTVDSKLKDTVSVKDFGATGNGSTDDTAAIQAAINYVESFYIPETYGSSSPGPGVTELFFPFGLYKITAALTVTRSMSFRGEGHSEFSNGPRIIQYTAATDHFRVNPIAQGCSVSWDDLTMTANGNGGTAGSCINITKTTSVCNSVRIRRCTFGTPQSLAINIQSSDDVMIGENLFDVSAISCIALGTSTATNVVSNCQIIGNTFYAISNFGILTYNVDGLVISSNRVYPSAAKLNTFLDGYNTLPYQLKNIVVSNNVLKGINCLAKLTAVDNLVFQGNSGSNLGAGSGASLSCIELTGSCSGITIVGNSLSGSFDTKNFYNDDGATVTSANITGNTFVNVAGVGHGLKCTNTIGTVAKNYFNSFAVPSISEHFYTTGSAISPSVIGAGSSFIFNLTVTGVRQGDQVQLSSPSTVWPFAQVGIVCWAYASGTNQMTIRYDNTTASPIGVPAHDFGIEITR